MLSDIWLHLLWNYSYRFWKQDLGMGYSRLSQHDLWHPELLGFSAHTLLLANFSSPSQELCSWALPPLILQTLSWGAQTLHTPTTQYWWYWCSLFSAAQHQPIKTVPHRASPIFHRHFKSHRSQTTIISRPSPPYPELPLPQDASSFCEVFRARNLRVTLYPFLNLISSWSH